MNASLEPVMIAVILTDLSLLGLGSIGAGIAVVAFQGLMLGIFAISATPDPLTLRLALIGVAGIVLKGLVYPAWLRRALRTAGRQREREPFIGYTASVMLGIVMFGSALWLCDRLPLRFAADLPLAAPAAFLTMFTGLFMVIARKQALAQCLGYLVLENGIYAFGLATVGEVPALVETGLLLDAFTAVLVMGVAMKHLHREFRHLDTDRLNTLKG